MTRFHRAAGWCRFSGNKANCNRSVEIPTDFTTADKRALESGEDPKHIEKYLPYRKPGTMIDDVQKPQNLVRTAKIIAAYISKNPISLNDLGSLIASVHGSLSSVRETMEPPAEVRQPAVPIKKSIFPDYLVCLEDGRHLKMMKRHLQTTYNLTPDEYRERWGLPDDYPMVAPNYGKHRSSLAKASGLGQVGRRKAS